MYGKTKFMHPDQFPISFIITIDGPAGSGKTTVSRMLADHLGFDYVDTGALYRGVAWQVLRKKVATDDNVALKRLCQNIQLDLIREKDGLHLWVDEVDVTGLIRTPEISMAASAVSAQPAVRDCLLGMQRSLGRNRRAVFEGRDMGTVVFPNAQVKFYLEADIEVRAQRRLDELPPEKAVSFRQVKTDMAKRDTADSSRALAPLKPAPDAIRVNTTDLSIGQVIDQLMRHIRSS